VRANKNLGIVDLQLPLVLSTLDILQVPLISFVAQRIVRPKFFTRFFDKKCDSAAELIFSISSTSKFCNTALNRINILKYQHRLN
jgi:hypothetical protein